MSDRITFIGAGNLAVHLSSVLASKGYVISQVYSRTLPSAKALAGKLNAAFTTSPREIDHSADIYFVALKDSAVDEVLQEVNFNNKLIVHCSGSLPLSMLEEYSKNTGVFYPLQTFSKNRHVDFSSVPVFIEAGNDRVEKKLLNIASKITDSVAVLDSERRKILHVSAVFSCNFVNHFYAIASRLLESGDIPFEVLRPLIRETAAKIENMSPEEAQTGPAVRFDENIISEHLEMLKGFQSYSELYKSISKSIFEHHKNR